MGTTIDSVAISDAGFRKVHSARRLADTAIRACLRRVGVAPTDVDLLINAGLYGDRNLGEPALAALIQEDIGANPEDPHQGGHGTFSFDVANGACGVLTGLQIADGFLHAGTIRRALVVAGDANPGFRRASNFPFAATGGALVCGWREGPVGISGFRWEASPEDGDSFNAAIAFDHGRNLLRVESRPEFADRAAVCASKAAAGLLADHGLTLGDIDLVVANPLTDEFRHSFAAYLGVASDRIVAPAGAARVHTAGLLVALDAAQEQGRMAEAHHVLLVSAGAGIVAGAALLER
jgi:3-oxoacyl-[acyl-carrier-protein] synthase III